MPFHTLTGMLGGSLSATGTLTLDYPSGTTQADFTGSDGHIWIVNQVHYESDDDEFSIAFGASTLVLTNATGKTFPTGSIWRLQIREYEQTSGVVLARSSDDTGDRVQEVGIGQGLQLSGRTLSLPFAVDASDEDHTVMVTGINIGHLAGAAGYTTTFDDATTGFGLAIEGDFFASNGALQHEWYMVTTGNERPISGAFSAGSVVNLVSGATAVDNDGSNTTVRIVAHSTITNYLRAGQRFIFRTLTAGSGVAVNTPYLVRTVLTPTSFIIETVNNADITNGSATGGTLDRGGWGYNASTVPMGVSIGATGVATYSNYLSPDTPAGEPAFFVANYVAAHVANITIYNGAAANASLRLQGNIGASDYSFQTFDLTTGPDCGIYENGPVPGYRIVIKSGGSIGINTETPRAALDVSGKFATSATTPTALVTGNVTFAVTSNFATITGTNAVTIGTITGGVAGMLLCLRFADANVTITDTDAATTDTVNLNAAFTGAANKTLLLIHNGTKWFEVSRSTNG